MATAATKAPFREDNNQMSGRGKKAQQIVTGPAVGNVKSNGGASGGVNRSPAGKGSAR